MEAKASSHPLELVVALLQLVRHVARHDLLGEGLVGRGARVRPEGPAEEHETIAEDGDRDESGGPRRR